MLDFNRRPFVLICNIMLLLQSLTTALIWQSYIGLCNTGLEFFPFDQQALLIAENTKSTLMCAQKCLSIRNCRTFNFDSQTKSCRLYEGDIGSTGSIGASLSAQSICGSLHLDVKDFLHHGHSCAYCEDSRYLTCINSSCQCPSHTYFDGTICRSQKINGSGCTGHAECRNDLNLTCLVNMQCGCK